MPLQWTEVSRIFLKLIFQKFFAKVDQYSIISKFEIKCNVANYHISIVNWFNGFWFCVTLGFQVTQTFSDNGFINYKYTENELYLLLIRA